SNFLHEDTKLLIRVTSDFRTLRGFVKKDAESSLDPVRARTDDGMPDEREAARSRDQRDAFDPPRAEAAADFNPHGRNHQREPDDQRKPPPAQQPEQRAASAGQERHVRSQI